VLDEVQTRLGRMWSGGEVLYEWIEWVKTDMLKSLGMLSEDGTIQIEHAAPRVLGPLLNAYNTAVVSNEFNTTSFPCQICLTSVKGARCISLACSHVFCRSCLEDFWVLCITEGEVQRVGCPDPGCVKAGSEAKEEDLWRVVSEDNVKRWRWLRAKRAVEKDPSIIWCPIQACQAAVPKPRESEDGGEESGWSRLRTCPSCGHSFCSFCKRTWHGPLAPCPMVESGALVRQYVAMADDSPEKLLMERRYGKKNMQRLVAKYEEELSNQGYLAEFTMPCPGCKIPVEKTMGCNHMTCPKCSEHFCYRCGDTLYKGNPYEHFNIRGISCYRKLFDFKQEDEEY